jgi:transposase
MRHDLRAVVFFAWSGRGDGVVMSMQPRPWPDVPELTARMARSSSRKGNLAMRIRDELGEVYADARFAAVFEVRGRPGVCPGQLMMASVLQFTENLTDRQAAEAVRDRITWKYALGLELEDPGFDASVLSEFRSRLVSGDLTSLALDVLLERLAGLGLVKAGGRQRTDSTHVLGAIRALNRLELAGETLRAALEALAVAAPQWLAGVIDPSWQQIYGARIDNLHLPESQTKRQALMVGYGTDGYHLLDQTYGPGAPPWLRELPAVEALRRIWVQQFYREITHGRQEVMRRREPLPEGDGLPPGRDRLISPYDLDARYSVKRDYGWSGYKVHFTETCDTPTDPAPDQDQDGRGDRPNLITSVATTEATVPDTAMTTPIHQQLADKDLLPAQHLLDSGYPCAELITHTTQTFGGQAGHADAAGPLTASQGRRRLRQGRVHLRLRPTAGHLPTRATQQHLDHLPATCHRRDRGVLAQENLPTLPRTPPLPQRHTPPHHPPLPRTPRSTPTRPGRANHHRMESPLRHPRRRRRHHPPSHPRHRHPHRPLPQA